MVVLFDDVIYCAFQCFFDSSFVFLFLNQNQIYIFYSASIVFLWLVFIFEVFETWQTVDGFMSDILLILAWSSVLLSNT